MNEDSKKMFDALEMAEIISAIKTLEQMDFHGELTKEEKENENEEK